MANKGVDLYGVGVCWAGQLESKQSMKIGGLIIILLPCLYNQLMEAEQFEEEREGALQEAETLQEDPWFDDDSEGEEELQLGEEDEQEGNVSIPVGETTKADLKNSEKEYLPFDHHVDYNYLILLLVLSKHRLVDLKQVSGLQQGYIDLVGWQSKLVVKTNSEAAAGAAIERLSDYIDNLSVVRLDMKGEPACRFSNFIKLKEWLRKDGVVMFGCKGKDRRQLFIGGPMKPSDLRAHQQRLRTIRLESAYLRPFRNTRSYRLIVDEVLALESMQRELLDFNQVKFAEVQRRNRAREVRVTLASISKKGFTPHDYEDFLIKQMRRYCVLAFCFPASEKYLLKPKVEGVAFKFITERAVSKSYMYVMALRQDFAVKHQEIAAEVGKLGTVLGVRFFYNVAPRLRDFNFDRQHYYCFHYPRSKPYSVSVFPKSREGFSFNWPVFLDRLHSLCEGQEANQLIE